MEILYTIPAAFGLGALHSLEPGHGKGVLTAYLISSKSKLKDAVTLGIISAFTHVFSIVLLAIVTTSSIRMLVPVHLSHWVELISGIIITLLGIRIFYGQLNPKVVVVGTIGHTHEDTCHYHHHHGVSKNFQENQPSLHRLVTIGFFTGLIPCPSALAIFLAAVAADQIPKGMSLIASFSIGSAFAMITLGMIAVRAGSTIKGLEQWRVIRLLSSLSSLLILGLGLFITVQSLIHLSFI